MSTPPSPTTSSFGRAIPIANGLLLLCLLFSLQDVSAEAVAGGSWALAAIGAVAVASCLVISLKNVRAGASGVMAVVAFVGMLITFGSVSALDNPHGYFTTAWIQLALACAWAARALLQAAGLEHRKPSDPRFPKGSDENGAIV